MGRGPSGLGGPGRRCVRASGQHRQRRLQIVPARFKGVVHARAEAAMPGKPPSRVTSRATLSGPSGARTSGGRERRDRSRQGAFPIMKPPTGVEPMVASTPADVPLGVRSLLLHMSEATLWAVSQGRIARSPEQAVHGRGRVVAERTKRSPTGLAVWPCGSRLRARSRRSAGWRGRPRAFCGAA